MKIFHPLENVRRYRLVNLLSKRLSSVSAIVFLFLVALPIPSAGTSRAFAAQTSNPGFQQFDLNNDGKPDAAMIDCACVTDNDHIVVFDGGNDMQYAPDWQGGTDINNDTWVFYIGHTKKANLIIEFLTTDKEQIARLYDDVTGDGTVAYQIEGKHINRTESPYWSLEVRAQPGWFTENGQVNLNVQAFLDKPAPGEFEFFDEKIAQQYMPHDGNPDVEYQMVDDNHDAVADYFLSRLINDMPPRYQVGKSRLSVNVEMSQPKRPDTALFWPFLDLQPLTGNSKNALRFFDRLPTVAMDWNSSSILGFDLPGYPIEAGYWVNSQDPIVDGQVNQSSYEAPHAWYDLAGDRDGNPELNIRLFSPLDHPREEIRYSWNQVNSADLAWDYKLSLLGNVPVDDTVDLHNFSLRMIPYEKLPIWVTDHVWELSTFVAREGKPRASAEGIYAWSTWSGADPTSPDNPSAEALDAALSYVQGVNTVPPYEFFNDIWEGFRGEYNFTHPQVPELYYSPIDHRLHLKGAEHGLLNLGNTKYVVYENKNGDDYFDQWRSIQAGSDQQQLYLAKNYLIYSSETELLLKQANPVNFAFITQPPRNHEEWLELGKKLDAYKLEFAPDDFKEMVLQFDGPEIHVEGGKIEEFRTTQEGFRFTLVLQPGFNISGDYAVDWNNLSPGSYVVTYSQNNPISIEPIQPPDIYVSITNTKLTQLKTSEIQFILSNDGLEDLPKATLELWVTAPDGNTTTAASETVQLLAGEPIKKSLAWAPPTVGQWILTPIIQKPDGHTIVGTPKQVSVLEAQAADIGNLFPLSVPSKLTPFIVIGLISFAGIGSLAFFYALRGTHD